MYAYISSLPRGEQDKAKRALRTYGRREESALQDRTLPYRTPGRMSDDDDEDDDDDDDEDDDDDDGGSNLRATSHQSDEIHQGASR